MIHPRIYQEGDLHKYSINLPTELYQRARGKAKALGIYSVSIYFRAILIREIEKSLSAEEILESRKQSIAIDSAKHRRVFLDNIHREYPHAFRVNVKKFLDKVISKQYTLF